MAAAAEQLRDTVARVAARGTAHDKPATGSTTEELDRALKRFRRQHEQDVSWLFIVLTLVPAVLGLQTVVGFNPPHKGIFAVAYSLALCLLTAIFLTIGRRAEFLLPAIDMSGTPPVARMARAAGPLLVGLLTGVASAYLAKLFGL